MEVNMSLFIRVKSDSLMSKKVDSCDGIKQEA